MCRTNWGGQNLDFTERSYPAYAHLDLKGWVDGYFTASKGDPRKGARAMYELAILDDPPLRVAVGTDAYDAIYEKLRAYDKNYKKYEKISTSTNADE